MENFEKNEILRENVEESGKEKEIEKDLENRVNPLNYSSDFLEFQEENIRKDKETIDKLIEKSEKIKKEAGKLFDQEKKD